MQFEADYYDGISPRAKRVLVTFQEGISLLIQPLHQEENAINDKVYPISECTIQAQLGSGKRLIDLPDDTRLETDYKDLEGCLPAKPASTFWKMVHYAETHLLFVVVSLVFIVIAGYAMLKYGVPVAAKYAAMATPASVEKDLGKQTLETLDHEQLGYFEATKLPLVKQNEIKAALAAMCKKTGSCPEYELQFRKSMVIGANAFALPGGYMVMTDELVELAKNNDEIIAVLAHELGHVKGRHALRQTLQGTVSGLIIIAITGDVSSVASGLPALMMNMSYSRELETEADIYSLEALKTACIPTKYFATLLLRLVTDHGGSGNSVPEMISSHPDTKTRIIPFLKEQQKCV